MIYYVKYDLQAICRKLIEDQMECAGIKYSLPNIHELDIDVNLTDDALAKLNLELSERGLEIVSSQKSILVQKTKAAIVELVQMDDKLVLCKTSDHLAKALSQDYRYLSRVFSEVTYTTIENYIILQKIERAKEMISCDELSFTEIAWRLNYSSVGHFSMQFKNTTGLTPTFFKRIIHRKRDNQVQEGNRLDKKHE